MVKRLKSSTRGRGRADPQYNATDFRPASLSIERGLDDRPDELTDEADNDSSAFSDGYPNGYTSR